MKKKYIFLSTLLCLFFLFPKPNPAQPSTVVEPGTQGAVEFDKFIYAATIPGAVSYEFNIRTAGGINRTLSKEVNYFSLNELQPEEVLYGEEYLVKSRSITRSGAGNWSSEKRMVIVPEPAYRYGKLRLYFQQDEFLTYSSFYKINDTVQNNKIENFNGLAHAAGIIEFNYPVRKFLELTGKHPMSCVDITFSRSFSVDSLINFFTADFIELAEPHYNYKLTGIPPEYNASNSNFWHLRDIDAPQAWNITDGDMQNVIIAVIDNVFDIDHIDLRKNIYVNMGEVPAGILSDYNGNGVIDADDLFTYYSTRGYSSLRELLANPPLDEIFNGRDDDGNGYRDDICGWNAANNNNRVTPYHTNGDFLSHGTHVAGIAGAVSGNGGICALANNNARILPISLSDFNRDYSGTNCADPMAAIEYILNLPEKPDIISMSFAGPTVENFEQALLLLEERYNVLSVSATGNDTARNRALYPAYYEKVIAVGASTNTNRRAIFSNYGDAIPGTYVIAPGEDIYSTIVGNTGQNLYGLKNGTSMACPLVSSLAGLLYSYNPHITPGIARLAIECGCDNNPSQIAGYDPADDGSGKINAYQSLLCLKAMAPVAGIRENFDFYCAGGLYYRFDAVSRTSVENCSYYWSVSGGAHYFENGNTGQNAGIRFLSNGIYTITLSITNPNGSSTHSIEIEVKDPSVTILNGSTTETCIGNNTTIFLELEGTPPFIINYTFNGLTTYVQDINSRRYPLTIPTSTLNPGTPYTFTVNHIYDGNACSGTAQASTTVNIRECLTSCTGKYNQVWHFSTMINENVRGLYFNPEPEVVDNPIDPIISSMEGSASISDYNGDPILTISGGYIYSTQENCNNVILNTVPTINNRSATQGYLILPDLSDFNKYYIISVGEIFGNTDRSLVFGTVDFSTSQCGEYTEHTVFANGDEEKLTSCLIEGDSGYWILTHAYSGSSGTHGINTYSILFEDGVMTYEGFTEIPTFEGFSSGGEMKFNLDMDLIAAAFSNTGNIELYRFNREENYPGNRLEFIGLKECTTEEIHMTGSYSLEFSPDSRYLYVGTRTYLYQIDVDNFNTSRSVIITPNILDFAMVSLGLGPDMKIYVGRNYSTGVINNPDRPGLECNYVSGIYPTGQAYGFPPRVPLSEIKVFIRKEIRDCSLMLSANSAVEISTYRWSTGETTPEISISQPGEYTLTAIFTNGCAHTDTILITREDLDAVMHIHDMYVRHSCDYNNEGSINVIVEGGTTPYNYTWEDQDGNIIGNRPDLQNLVPGTYFLTVTDVEGCEATVQQSIYPVSSPVISAEVISDICMDGGTGSARVTLGGLGYYDILWSDGETTQAAVNLPAGISTVTVTSTEGCYSTAEVEIRTINADPYFQASGSCIFAGNRELYFYPVNIPREEWGGYSFTWEISGDVVSGMPEYYPNFEYEGFYCVSLTVNSGNCTTTHTERVYVYPGSCFCDNSNYDALSIIIEEDTHWTGRDIYIRDELIVKPGATLILKNCKLLFGPAGRLIIEGRAKVTGVETLFTSLERGGCDHMWYGIEVHGNHMMASTHSSQGILELQGGSMIKNAHIGVLLGARNMDWVCNPENTGYEDWMWGAFNRSLSGGLIYSIDQGHPLIFQDNGIHIKGLRKKRTVNDSENLKIANMNFRCDNGLSDQRYNSAHRGAYSYMNQRNPWVNKSNQLQRTNAAIEIEGLKGFAVSYCRFDNADICINTMDAKYNVHGSSFSNAYHGIFAKHSMQALNNIAVSQCSFDRIYGSYQPLSPSAHITAWGSRYDKIIDNEFGTRSSGQEDSHYGIYYSGSSGFNIMENDFYYMNVGTYVNNSRETGGFIGASTSTLHYDWTGNMFTSCNTNISTYGDNPFLKLKCNQCQNDFNDLYFVNFITKGILADQGEMPQSRYQAEKKGAGNLFSGYASNPKKIITARYIYNYFHHRTPDEAIPDVSFSVAPIYPYNIGVDRISNAFACSPPVRIRIDRWYEECEDMPYIPYTPAVPESPSKEDMLIILDGYERRIFDLRKEYEDIMSILDKGNTKELLSDIGYAKDPSELCKKLMEYSPLSDTVLAAFLDKFYIKEACSMDIFIMNMPLSRSVEPYFRENIKNLPEKERDILVSYQAYNPVYPGSRNNLNNRIKNLEFNRKLSLNSLISELINGNGDDIKMATGILEKENDPQSLQVLSGIYISGGEYDRVYGLLEELKKYDGKYYGGWIDYTLFIINLYRDGRSFHNMTETEKDYLRGIASGCPHNLATVNAQSVLEFYFGEYFKPCPEEDMPYTREGGKSGYINMVDLPYLKDNYPNPFSNETHIGYYIPEGMQGQIIISDIYGRIVGVYNAPEGQNTLNLDTSGWSNGVYIYGLTVNGEKISYKKMILTR